MDGLDGSRCPLFPSCLKPLTIAALLTIFNPVAGCPLDMLSDIRQRALLEIWIVSDLILVVPLLDLVLNLNHFPGCQFATVAMEEGAVVSRDLQ